MDGAPVASTRETIEIGLKVIAPTVASGVVKRRRAPMALAERLQTDRAAVRLLSRLRDRHGPGPLRLRVPGRSIAVVLSPAHVGRLLEGTPEPFTPDNAEKHAALGKFRPHGVLVSRGAATAERGQFWKRHSHEAVLQTHRPLHHLAPALLPVLHEEVDRLTAVADRSGELDWRRLERSWQRTVRRLVFGGAADRELIEALVSLRRSGNWSYLGRRRSRARAALAVRLRAAIDGAGPGTLGEAVRGQGADASVRPEDQVAHWLFAFDAAGIAIARTLALLAVHPGHRLAALNELATEDPDEPAELPFLRACALESLRLWPTTPMLLRDGTEPTRWGGGSLPGGTAFLVYTPLFHRDPARRYADRFAPEIWVDGTAEEDPALVPFGGGPARCPGRNLVLFSVTSALARLLREREWRLSSPSPIFTGRPVPATLDHFGLAFRPAPARHPLLGGSAHTSAAFG
ncbi:cytochrome P450 [Glycomyces luteolus]|uniref:Cytochrome P450 n=1 Tax=Glycomyces luteolus TaxID=2670330 RepID=A0A9X3P4X4_9ACTN|nr:cytochrome P450 [Glycomyces luteolus]MDA1358119.1 cytochrome P450 [Glycomyces luteolus]